MSINDFFNKIKDKLSIDTYVIICLFIIIMVGVSAFALGRLSIGSNSNRASNIIIANRGGKVSDQSNSKNKRYVASKKGKLFYINGCSKARKILKKNQIWFATSINAQKSGYKPSLSCK